MEDQKRTSGSQEQNKTGNRNSEQSGNQQRTTFDQNNYGNDPNNMANYSGNFGTGTYDTDYGKGTFPDTDAEKQGDNWIDKVGNRQPSSGEGRENKQ